MTLVADRRGSSALIARGGAGLGAPATDDWALDPGLREVVRSRQPLFVPDAQRPRNQERWASVLLLPVEAADQLAGVLVIAWTKPVNQLDPFDGQVLELLSLQAGPVLTRVRQVEELDRAATTDPLTGVGNRRAFEQAMAELADDAVLVLFDLNDFKVVNDTRGHPAGDRVLQAFAAALTAAAGRPDRACRIGGDEFAVIAGGGLRAAQAMVDRLGAGWTRPEGVGFSAGFAGRRPGESPEDLGARADQALYATKQLHRERVRVAQR